LLRRLKADDVGEQVALLRNRLDHEAGLDGNGVRDAQRASRGSAGTSMNRTVSLVVERTVRRGPSGSASDREHRP
jgi:hypothetical protein